MLTDLICTILNVETLHDAVVGCCKACRIDIPMFPR